MSDPPFLRTPYNYDRNAAGDEDAIACPEPTLAKQSFREECDINYIVMRFGLTGELPTNIRQPEYRDFTTVVDYHTALTAIRHAEEAFAAMPADVRARFNNDPEQFVVFCTNPDNLSEVRKLGLTSQTQEEFENEQLAERARADARAEGTQRPRSGSQQDDAPQPQHAPQDSRAPGGNT